MPEFRKVDSVVASPTSCVGCGTHAGPFIDLGIALPVYGALYLCAETDTRSGCAGQIATLNGGLTAKQRQEALAEAEEIKETAAMLDAKLKAMAKSKLVKVEDLLDFSQSASSGGTFKITLGG